MRIDLGRGRYAEYEPGTHHRQPVPVIEPDGARKASWGSLISHSNGEILDQLPTARTAFRRTAEGDYRMQHRAPDPGTEDEPNDPMHELGHTFPSDIYEHPEWYGIGRGGGDEDYDTAARESWHHVQRVRGRPEAKVRIYRALPADYANEGFHTGDWVSPSKTYARMHARQSDPKDDWPIISTMVPAKHVHTDGNDINEWGYNGPDKPYPMISHKGGYNQEISNRADGSIGRVKRRKPKTAVVRNIRRGVSVWPEENWHPDAAERIVHGRAKPEDLLPHLWSEEAGEWWYHPHHADLDDAKLEATAHGDESLARNHADGEYGRDEKGHILGDVGVVMEADHPGHWDPADNPGDALMGNSYIPNRQKLHLHTLHYTPDWGDTWHTLHLPKPVDIHTKTTNEIRSSAAIRHVNLEDSDADATGGIMVAFAPPPDIVDHLVQEDGEPPQQLHVTLLYVGKDEDFSDKELAKLPELVKQWSKTQRPLKARVQGAGTFINGEREHVLWASVDIPGGTRVHDSLVDFLRGHGLAIEEDHGWIPHMTLSYEKYHVRFLPKVQPMDWTIRDVWYCTGDVWQSFPLGRG